MGGITAITNFFINQKIHLTYGYCSKNNLIASGINSLNCYYNNLTSPLTTSYSGLFNFITPLNKLWVNLYPIQTDSNKNGYIPYFITKIGLSQHPNINQYNILYISNIDIYYINSFQGQIAKIIDLTKCTQVPSCTNFSENWNGTYYRVPSSLYSEWINATNWSTVADYIIPVEV